ncbi:MAG: DNA translocase FtsK 4TM domain-containing protein [Deltaproteobacteria bacterium]|nr:DNA translocase FtsK 4TM domain-containing protein [Deltaproteobacteria bacterium]
MARSSTREWIRREVTGLSLVAGSVYLTISLLSFSLDQDAGSNLGGPVGEFLADVLRQSVGLAAFLIPFYGLLAGWRLLRNQPLGPVASRLSGGGFLLLFAAISLALILPGTDAYRAGGWMGGWIANRLFLEGLGRLGAYLFTLAGLALSLAFALDVSVLSFGRGFMTAGQWAAARADAAREAYLARRRVPAPARPEPEIVTRGEQESAAGDEPARPSARKKAAPIIAPKPVQEKFEFVRDDSAIKGNYRLPPLDFLNPAIAVNDSVDREALLTNSRILEKKLRDFGVEGNVVKVNPGPVVNMYEYEPAAGVKISRIVNLSDDLSMALRADSVRIVGPLPGKAVVGIEVSNRQKDEVNLREMLTTSEFQQSAYKLPLALGKDIYGSPVVAPLEAMPHLLVAGATGTGKSVFLNNILMSILYRSTPEGCRLLLIDPKLLELSVYEGIPHLLTQVVTNPKRAAAALHGVVHKMEERYRIMAAKGVRNIDQYNRKMEKETKHPEKAPAQPQTIDGVPVEFPQRLPYIVVMIDELADLMVVAGRDVEESLTRLAQMARAASIHLILATQRPSVDVLTGVIKANFPTRVSFQVFSRVDSRTILDHNGAEALLGQGDMLFVPPNTSKLRRIHGGFVTEEEIKRVVEFLKEQGAPSYDDTIIQEKKEAQVEGDDGEDDEVYDQAVAVVTQHRQASISFIQRKLRIGYNRAARIMERMEREGVVGAADVNNRREILVKDLSVDDYE